MAHVSSDGHWVTYASSENGGRDVYVQSFPASGRKFQISTNGGVYPKWRSDNKELFYVSPTGALMAVDVTRAEPGRSFEVGVPHRLFQGGLGSFYEFDVSPDGQRFVINSPLNSSDVPPIPITVVLNWTALLNKK